MIAHRRFLAAALLLCAPAFAQAAADVALVNRVSGDVSHISPGGIPKKARAFMMVQQGDRFAIPAGGSLRIVYFAGGRQETWTGPASFRAAAGQGQRIGGRNPQVATLPPSVASSLARVPELIRSANLPGKSARVTHRSLSAQERADLAEAKITYGKMRATAPAEDVTPELYLFSVLQGYALYDQLGAVAENMRRRQPRSDEIRALATWAGVSRP